MAKAKKEKMEANPFKLKKELPRLPGYIIVTLWTAFIFCMIGWIILASLSTTKEIFTGSLLASGLHFENYTKALFTNKAALNLLNSVIYTVPSCILIIVVCAPAAYCMSRFKFRGAGLIQALIIIGLAIPNIMIVIYVIPSDHRCGGEAYPRRVNVCLAYCLLPDVKSFRE